MSGSEQPRTSVALPEGPRSLQLAKCKLVVLKGPKKGTEQTLSRDIVRIGKSDANDLVLDDETVSRHHCEILRDPKGYLLRDLRSTNGTFLDGAEIREAYLRSGSLITIGNAELRFSPIEERIEILPSDKEKLGELVGRSLKMREIFGLIERIAPTDATVLVQGETGTGKDLVARTIHSLSKRAKGPCIVVDCGAVAGNLIESELFGHEKGAFTGASATRQGAFELANGGTLFLDELGELSLDLQPKLLRVIETREFRRVGGNRTISTDIRIVAATKQDLLAEVKKGKFREDLYFRLSVVPLHVPALRERKEDLPLIIDTLRERIKERGDEIPPLDEQQLAALRAHDWPGNIRELRNVLERGQYFSGTQKVVLNDLPSEIYSPPVDFDAALSYRANKERWELDFERRYLKWLMGRSSGNISKAAREADMDRKYLHKLLKKHGLG